MKRFSHSGHQVQDLCLSKALWTLKSSFFLKSQFSSTIAPKCIPRKLQDSLLLTQSSTSFPSKLSHCSPGNTALQLLLLASPSSSVSVHPSPYLNRMRALTKPFPLQWLVFQTLKLRVSHWILSLSLLICILVRLPNISWKVQLLCCTIYPPSSLPLLCHSPNSQPLFLLKQIL